VKYDRWGHDISEVLRSPPFDSRLVPTVSTLRPVARQRSVHDGLNPTAVPLGPCVRRGPLSPRAQRRRFLGRR
jgi:hypothetical protein